jgi:hypothetical protein
MCVKSTSFFAMMPRHAALSAMKTHVNIRTISASWLEPKINEIRRLILFISLAFASFETGLISVGDSYDDGLFSTNAYTVYQFPFGSDACVRVASLTRSQRNNVQADSDQRSDLDSNWSREHALP